MKVTTHMAKYVCSDNDGYCVQDTDLEGANGGIISIEVENGDADPRVNANGIGRSKSNTSEQAPSNATPEQMQTRSRSPTVPSETQSEERYDFLHRSGDRDRVDSTVYKAARDNAGDEALKFVDSELSAEEQHEMINMIKHPEISQPSCASDRPNSVMVSYCRRDGEFITKLHAAFTSAGMDVWIDMEDIPKGVDWRESIAGSPLHLYTSPSSLHPLYCGLSSPCL